MMTDEELSRRRMVADYDTNENVRQFRRDSICQPPQPPDVEPPEFSDKGRDPFSNLRLALIVGGCFVFFVAAIVWAWPA